MQIIFDDKGFGRANSLWQQEMKTLHLLWQFIQE